MRRLLSLFALLAAVPAPAQLISSLTPPPSRAEMEQIQATMCAPASAAPLAETVGGAVGSATTCVRSDARAPRLSRTASCTLTASGTCTAAWTSPFPTGTSLSLLGDPAPINTGATQPITCNATAAPTVTGVAIKCWTAQSTTMVLGALLNPFALSVAGIVVQATALPVSQ
jgi:hypothetical protein